MDSNNECVEGQKKKLKKDIMESMESTAARRETEEEGEEEEKEPSLLQDMLGVLFLEAPIILVVVVLGLIIGHFEGWGIIERYVTALAGKRSSGLSAKWL